MPIFQNTANSTSRSDAGYIGARYTSQFADHIAPRTKSDRRRSFGQTPRGTPVTMIVSPEVPPEEVNPMRSHNFGMRNVG